MIHSMKLYLSKSIEYGKKHADNVAAGYQAIQIGFLKNLEHQYKQMKKKNLNIKVSNLKEFQKEIEK